MKCRCGRLDCFWYAVKRLQLFRKLPLSLLFLAPLPALGWVTKQKAGLCDTRPFLFPENIHLFYASVFISIKELLLGSMFLMGKHLLCSNCLTPRHGSRSRAQGAFTARLRFKLITQTRYCFVSLRQNCSARVFTVITHTKAPSLSSLTV